ncbi:MAG: FIST N-terminal domain-containing protein [Patescibacteria group bacterium]
METVVGVGASSDSNSKEAGMEACRQAFEKVSSPELVIVFASSKLDQKEMLSGVREISKGVPLIGCSTAGEITSAGAAEGSVAVMAISSDVIDFTIGKGGDLKSGVREAGAQLVKNITGSAKDKTNCLLMLTDVLNGNGAEVVRGIQDVLGSDTLIIGGAAGDDFLFKQTFNYYNGDISSSSVVGVGLSGDYGIGVGVRHGWVSIGAPMKATKSKDAVLKELDGKPAVSIYEDYFGKKAEELREEPLAKLAITYPLGMSVEGSDELLIRDPITVDAEGAITCAAEIPEGAEVRLMIGSKEEAIAAAKDAAQKALAQLAGKTPRAVIVFNCIARRKLFGRDAGDEIAAIREVLGKDVPLIGFYTYGEIAPFNESADKPFSRFHNETAVVAVIGD